MTVVRRTPTANFESYYPHVKNRGGIGEIHRTEENASGLCNGGPRSRSFVGTAHIACYGHPCRMGFFPPSGSPPMPFSALSLRFRQPIEKGKGRLCHDCMCKGHLPIPYCNLSATCTKPVRRPGSVADVAFLSFAPLAFAWWLRVTLCVL